MAARADRGRTLPRSHGHFDTLLVGTEVGVLVDKTSETMAAVQNRDRSSPVSRGIDRRWATRQELIPPERFPRCDSTDSVCGHTVAVS